MELLFRLPAGAGPATWPGSPLLDFLYRRILDLWPSGPVSESLDYSGRGFLLAFSLVWLLGRILGTFLVFFPWKRTWDSLPASLISGGLSLLLTWYRVEMVLFILATVPLPMVQDLLSSSFLVQFMMNLSPFSRLLLRQLWVTSVLGSL